MNTDSELDDKEQTALLAEDDEMIRDILAQYLQRLGYNVLEAKNGKTAIDLLELSEEEIDLIVTDLLMPEAGGEKVVRTAQQIGCCDRILIISGFSEQMSQLDKTVGQQAAYLEKPFTFSAFEEKIEELSRTSI